MTDAADEARPAVLPGRRRALVALAVTQTTGWGVLYYALPVALPVISRDTGWSATAVTGAFSAGLVASALVGIPVGRWLDRYGPRLVMTTGSTVGALAAASVALAPTYPTFVLAWLVAGAAMAAVFYQAAFAAVTRWYRPDPVRALTTLTLVAGLASTVSAPVTHLLVGELGWRGAYLALAAVLAVVCVPLHALALTAPWHVAPRPAEQRRVPPEVRSVPFAVLAGALTLGAFCAYGASFALIPTLTEKGVSAGLAVTAFGLLGAGQLLGRIGYPALSSRTTATGRTVLVLLASAAVIGALAAVPGPAGLLVALAVALGAVRGAATLLQATAVTDRWGGDRYGTLSGWLAAPVTAAAALAPWAVTASAGRWGGHRPVLIALAVLLLCAVAGIRSLRSAAQPDRVPVRTDAGVRRGLGQHADRLLRRHRPPTTGRRSPLLGTHAATLVRGAGRLLAHVLPAPLVRRPTVPLDHAPAPDQPKRPEM